MNNEEAILVLKSTSVNLGRRSGKTAYAEALEMAITALQVQEKLQDVEYMCRLSGGADYFRVFAALLEKTNNSNDGVENSNLTQSNGIESKVKGMTACRVPEGDTICRKKVEYKLTALVNEIEEIFSHIRERNEDDSVCGLCEYDGAYIGQSGDWCGECPGFDKADCFKLKDKYRKEWLDIDG